MMIFFFCMNFMFKKRLFKKEISYSKLDEYLLDEDLIKRKREEHAKKPKRLSFGPDCPICHEKNRDRDHLSRHFMAELMELVNEMPNKKQCSQCPYKSSKREYMAKHVRKYRIACGVKSMKNIYL